MPRSRFLPNALSQPRGTTGDLDQRGGAAQLLLHTSAGAPLGLRRTGGTAARGLEPPAAGGIGLCICDKSSEPCD